MESGKKKKKKRLKSKKCAKKKERLESDVCEICPFSTVGEGVRQGAEVSYSFAFGGK